MRDDTTPSVSAPTVREGGDIAAVLAAHRQQHLAQVGASECVCGNWVGPFTQHAEPGRRFADHLADAIEPLIAERERAARAEDRDKLQAIIREQALDWLILDGQAMELSAKVARVEALAESWRYKGEFGWGAWQEGEGPDHGGYILDQAAADLRAALTPGPHDFDNHGPTDNPDCPGCVAPETREDT